MDRPLVSDDALEPGLGIIRSSRENRQCKKKSTQLEKTLFNSAAHVSQLELRDLILQ